MVRRERREVIMTRELTWPRADFSRVPYPVFFDPGYYEREQAAIFRGPVWNYLVLEIEIPRSGDFRTTYVGDTPVVVVRAEDDSLHAFVNRCAHRGTLLVRTPGGNAKDFTCVYHHWCYDRKGNLIGVPFLRGLKGKGGMPKDFRLTDHNLRTVKVESYGGVVFGTFAEDAEPLAAFLDTVSRDFIDRVLAKPIHLMGYMRQRIPGNWKLYFENLHDVSHAGLLHRLSTIFGQHRSTYAGGFVMDKYARHKVTSSIYGSDDIAQSKEGYGHTDWIEGEHRLNDPSVFEFHDELGDRKSGHFLTVFPNLVIQQLGNSLATRQIRPKSPTSFELYWTFFGYIDDDRAMRLRRLKQANNVGPAGLTSMEDGEAGRLVQLGIRGTANDDYSVIEMGGLGPVGSQNTMLTEVGVRAFWLNYCELLGIKALAGTPQRAAE
jgi:anthranilate 1,2-dioxygenase large subunit